MSEDVYSADAERRDQAELAENIGRNALEKGDYEKAIRLFEKALRLFPSDRVRALLSQTQKLKDSGHKPAPEPHQQPRPQPQPQPQQHHSSHSQAHPKPAAAKGHSPRTHERKDAPSAAPSSGGGSHHYTAEQLDEVKVKLKVKDYYEVLELSRTANDNDIKKSYRKLALKFHPDKNHAPGAAEVFKSVSTAYACLSDPQKRAHYDQFGLESSIRHEQTGGASGHGHFQQEDLTPEDIFEMFFNAQGRAYGRGNPFMQQHFYQRARNPPAEGGAGRSGLLTLVQLLPFVLLLLFTFLNSPGGDDQIFSLQRTNSFTNERQTNSGITYYVSPTFYSRYSRDPRAIFQVESMVEQQHMKKLQDECNNERKQQKKLQAKARKTENVEEKRKLVEQAEAFEMPSCERLELFGRA